MSVNMDFIDSILIALIGGILASANFADKSIRKEKTQKFSHFLQNIKFAQKFQSAFYSFDFLTDRIFGTKIFSIRALSSSIVLSTIWFVVILLLCILFFPIYRTALGAGMLPIVQNFFFQLISAVLIFDYFSITTTRIIIQ